eukprot:scaffold24_cov341-Pavlova_lutheri.AAC.76
MQLFRRAGGDVRHIALSRNSESGLYHRPVYWEEGRKREFGRIGTFQMHFRLVRSHPCPMSSITEELPSIPESRSPFGVSWGHPGTAMTDGYYGPSRSMVDLGCVTCGGAGMDRMELA